MEELNSYRDKRVSNWYSCEHASAGGFDCEPG